MEEVKIMGIVNLTDDSFYSPSRMLDPDGKTDNDRLLATVGKMLDEGAAIIDLGACSTRPGSTPVPEETEIRRLIPALTLLRETFPRASFSVDTFRSGVVRSLFDVAGPFIVNDISAGEASEDMLELVGKLGLPYIAMHMRGTPETMQAQTDYTDVTAAVAAYFDAFAIKAEKAGIRDWFLDPGFGFAKTAGQNFELLAHLGEFSRFGRPVLVGISRKSFIYRTLGITPEEALPATQALHLQALVSGATVLRVHDVAEAARTVLLYKSLVNG